MKPEVAIKSMYVCVVWYMFYKFLIDFLLDYRQFKSREIQNKAFLDNLWNNESLLDWIWLVEAEAIIEIYMVSPSKTHHPPNS